MYFPTCAPGTYMYSRYELRATPACIHCDVLCGVTPPSDGRYICFSPLRLLTFNQKITPRNPAIMPHLVLPEEGGEGAACRSLTGLPAKVRGGGGGDEEGVFG